MKLSLLVLLVFSLSVFAFSCDDGGGKGDDNQCKISHLQASAGPSCSTSITACGCVIDKPGVYNVTEPLTAVSTTQLTQRNAACIEIKTSDVKLFTNGNNIKGPGTGIGVLVLHDAHNTFMSAAASNWTFTTFSGWKYGLQSDADNAFSEAFYFVDNTTGVFLNGVDHNQLNVFGAYNNDSYGVVVRGGRKNQLGAGGAWGNSKAGVDLTCNTTGNYVFEDYSYANGVGGSGGHPQYYGIEIDKGSTGNVVADNPLFGNTIDLFDGNDLGDNIWHSNQKNGAGSLTESGGVGE